MKFNQLFSILIVFLTLSAGLVFANPINDNEKNGLQLMREEEKLAHDVYQFLYEKWELPIFDNISQAETRHFNAIGFLIENFELKDLANKEAGRFQNEELQDLYDSLTQREIKTKAKEKYVDEKVGIK